MKKWVTICSLALIMIPACAIGQEDVGNWGFMPQDWELTLQGSGTSDDEVDNTTFSIETSLGYFFTRNLELGLRQGIGYLDVEDGDDQVDGSTRLFVDYHFDYWQMQPFLGVNLGYLYGDGVVDSWIAGPEVGLKIFVLSSTFLYALMEYNFTFEDSDDAGDAFDDGRFVYAFGMGTTW